MTLHQILSQTGYAVSENSFPETESPSLPFILWEHAGSQDLHADNKPYKKIRAVNIRLCNDGNSADVEAQSRLEAVFVSAKIPFRLANVAFITDERMTESLYDIEVMM